VATVSGRSGTPVHVVGGGLAGLVAAITVAERGAPVVLYEAGDRLGGRAVDNDDRRRNLGPHVLLADGALARWLGAHRLLPALARSPISRARFVTAGGVRSTPPLALAAATARRMRQRAPVDESFRGWSHHMLGEDRGEQLCRLGGLFTFHHDPGSLSARFVWDRFGRYLRRPDHIRSILGGWSTLVAGLANRAEALGVDVQLGEALKPGRLPEDGPVIVTTPLPAAARLLDEPLHWTGARTALVDLGLAAAPGLPNLVMDLSPDLDTCCFVDRITAADPSAAPAGEDLFQCQLGVAADVPAAAAFARIDRTLDVVLPPERRRRTERWRSERVVEGASGAVDPPGTTWRDRPGIERSAGFFLAGDMVAAPGLLSEVSVNSAVRAAQLALADRRNRAFAPRWPAVALGPERQLAVLAASLAGGGAAAIEVDGPIDVNWPHEPASEIEPGLSIRVNGPLVRAEAATESRGRTRITTLVAVAGRGGRGAPLVGRLSGRLARWLARRRLARLVRSSP
jgi:phytoene dehydrogenase-like protein